MAKRPATKATSERELFFLCGGGGRVVLDLQLLPTGGWRYCSPEFNLHVDPGPGALVKSVAHKLNNAKLDCIFVSHNHLDHVNDANAMIEAMTFSSKSFEEFKHWKKGTLVTSKSVLEGAKGEKQTFEKTIPDYFQNMCERVVPAKAGEKVEWKEKGAILKAVKAEHEDPTAIGFVLEHRGVKVGYTGDTQMFPGLAEQFVGCAHWVVNCLRADSDKFPFHLCTDEVIELLQGMKKKPKVVVLSHLGKKFMLAGPGAQARKVEQTTGVHTLTANEGVRVDLAESPLSAFA